ncbi:DEAD/DEAH box helicase [Kribbella sp. NPDC051770]|uniref:DEAD/DEAH box helicase n=1 Tax=Kribbella sp. NPDC051770 TaxID=3155413 RepID=UPI00344AB584
MSEQGEAPDLDRLRSIAGRPARRLIQRLSALQAAAEELVERPAVLRAQARDQLRSLTRRQVQNELDGLAVSSLQEVVGARFVGVLEEARYATIGRLVGVSDEELVALPGIGAKTASKISDAVRTVVDQVAQSARFRFDPDRPTEQQRELLATLAAVRRADAAAAELIGPAREMADTARTLLEAAAPARGRVRLWFAGRERRRAALDALGQLEVIDGHPRTAWLEGELARHAVVAEDNDLWGEYAADAASYNAILSTVGEVAVEGEAAQGFIPEELRQRITAVPLDTSLVRSTLRGYQVFGAQYLIHQERSILGDEMGLGKTIQALAAAAHLAARGQQRFLVVCPASVQINWLNEIEKHTRLQAHSLHGAHREGAARRWLRDGGVAVTTFGTLGSLSLLDEHETALLIVDEAHYVKNPSTARSREVAEASALAQRVVFLTGTPMENRVEEFRTLVGYLQPATAKRLKATDAVAGAERFRRAVAPVYLRRNQEDVLTELPEKIEIDDWVLLEDQRPYVDAVRSGNLMKMRQATFPAKTDRIAEIIEEAREDGHKVIIFSFFLNVLAELERSCSPVGIIQGSLPPAQRQHLIDTFTATLGHAVLLSQIDAGGVGLNVQAASVVVITEPQWKPSTEDQAIARAHRMGQIRTVQVHRLLAKDTVDERLRDLQAHKRDLFDEYARQSEAKSLDPRATDTTHHNALQDQIVQAEQDRLGLTPEMPKRPAPEGPAAS